MAVILTPGQKALRDSLKAQEEAIRATQREIDKQKQDLCAEVFRHVLEQGDWVLDGESLTPANADTENTLVEVLSFAHGLGYHDVVRVDFDGISFIVRVDDGCVRMFLSRTPTLEQFDHVLTMENFLIRPWLLDRLERMIREEESRVSSFLQRTERLRALHDSFSGVAPAPSRRSSVEEVP